ncbi:hypothetical protein [Ruegeria arenilitoris]|uniref:hypothetical protein n=1 Tax=Ruegeria arenilitoris TaxID=1173585 RepID=UPI00147DAE73|nr:hypothetical protein [Ruegeria arenilitoris]
MNTRPLGHEFARLFVLCFSVLVLVYLPLIQDPFVRHDDFPALLGTRRAALLKTLDEGRWLNYWWQFRPVFLPSPVHFVLYLVGWSLFSAATALSLLDRDVDGWYKGFLAIFVALSVPAYLMSFWFNTLLPGVWVVALFAVAVLYLPHRTALALMVVAVPLSFMAYTTYPFLLVTLVLLSRKAPKTYKSMAITLGVFVVSLALGVLAVYSLNYIYHGVFGIPVAQWREPTEVNSFADLLANIEKQKVYLHKTLEQMGGGDATHGVVIPLMFLAAWLALFIWNRIIAIGILAAVLVGLAPLVGKALMSGVQVPLRTLGWVWVLFGFCIVSVAVHLSKSSDRWLSLARIAILCVLLFNILAIAKTSYFAFPPWQDTTRKMASSVPEGTETIYVFGDYMEVHGARKAAIQQTRGLQLRLAYLTGATVFICDDKPKGCNDVEPPFDAKGPEEAPVVKPVGQDVFILLPEPDTVS